jgi:hypothetical protein
LDRSVHELEESQMHRRGGNVREISRE